MERQFVMATSTFDAVLFSGNKARRIGKEMIRHVGGKHVSQCSMVSRYVNYCHLVHGGAEVS